MFNPRKRGAVALAGVLAAVAIGSAAPAHADAGQDCDVRLERLIAQFYEQEERHGWDALLDWWDARWHAYYQSCVVN